MMDPIDLRDPDGDESADHQQHRSFNELQANFEKGATESRSSANASPRILNDSNTAITAEHERSVHSGRETPSSSSPSPRPDHIDGAQSTCPEDLIDSSSKIEHTPKLIQAVEGEEAAVSNSPAPEDKSHDVDADEELEGDYSSSSLSDILSSDSQSEDIQPQTASSNPHETFSPLQSRSVSYQSRQHSTSFEESQQSPTIRGAVEQATDLLQRRRELSSKVSRGFGSPSKFQNLRTTMSDGSPQSERSLSPLRAASVEVLAAADEHEHEDDVSNNLPSASPGPAVKEVDDQITNWSEFDENGTKDVSLGPPMASSSVRTHISTSHQDPMDSDQSTLQHPRDPNTDQVLNLADHAHQGDEETAVTNHTEKGRQTSPRPFTADTKFTESSTENQTDADALPDISYEQSFMPPESLSQNSPPTSDVVSEPLPENEKEDANEAFPDQVDAEHKARASNGVGAINTAHSKSNGPMTPSQASALQQVSAKALRFSNMQQQQDTTPIVKGPQKDIENIQGRPWETPAATKEYINELPTRTAITRRVENFQIPPEHLATLQPDIANVNKNVRRSTDKLSLKESSAQIDALLNENWGLKMKIMFLDKHFEHDRDKASLVAENVRLQTNGYNFVQQVKSRDKTIKKLEKRIADLELEKQLSARQLLEAEVRADQIRNHESSGDEDLHRIHSLEEELDGLVEQLQDARQHIEKLEQSLADRNSVQAGYQQEVETENNELREALAEAEDELVQRGIEYETRIEELTLV